jgi:putative tricarboxylic transport membrane protein
MWESAAVALGMFLNPFHLGMLFVGVVEGILIGLLPGMGGTAAVAILLPFIYNMGPHTAMAVLVGALAVVHTSDTITAVLIGTPASSASATTVMDGHPLAKQGQAARALSAAFLSSMIGGFIGVLALTLSIPIARPLVLTFGSPELFMLCFLGLGFAAFLTGETPLKGLVSAALGLLVGAIGVAPNVAHYRYTFDQLYLMDGLPLVCVVLGLFGVAEVIDLLAGGGQIAERIGLGSGWIQGVRDVIEHRWMLVRGSLIGVWTGILPGIGASAGSWMSYGHAVVVSKERDQFGKGDIRGVIAPEAANNAVEAGDLIPTLLFSVPGGPPSAILMGALIVFGIQPGPGMITEHMDLLFTVIWSFALANIIGAGLCLFLCQPLARLTAIRFVYLAPAILIIMIFGAFQSSKHLGDLAVMLGLGLLGWGMKRLGWARPPFLIAFVLSNPTERYLWISVNRFGWSWLTRPGTLAILGLLVASLVYWIVSRKRRPAVSPSTQVAWRFRPTALFTVFVILLLAYAAVEATTFPFYAALLPFVAAVPAVLMAAGQLVLQLRSGGGSKEVLDLATSEQAGSRKGTMRALLFFGVVLAYYGLIWMVGFRPATLLFLVTFLRVFAASSWFRTGVYTAVIFAVLQAMVYFLSVEIPEGLWSLGF